MLSAANFQISDANFVADAIKAVQADWTILDSLTEMAAAKQPDANCTCNAMKLYAELAEQCMPAAQAHLCEYVPRMLEIMSEKKAPKAAKDAAAKAVSTLCKKITPNGIKDLLPKLLEGTDDHLYKSASRVLALTSIASFADSCPDQLGVNLPIVVPKVSQSIIDTDSSVCEAAEAALTGACDVIGNRDLEHMTPHILRSITHPEDIKETMHELAGVRFVQSVESPALAMVTPMLICGLKSGITSTMRQAAVIIDNMSRLVNDPLDAAPFMGLLIPVLHYAVETLADPEARSVAERTLAEIEKMNVQVEKELARQKKVDMELVVGAVKQHLAFADKHVIMTKHVAQICSSLMALRNFEAEAWKEVETFAKLVSPAKGPAGIPALREACDSMVKPLPAVDEDDDDAEELCNCVFTLAYGTKILLHNTNLKLKRGAKYGLLGGNDSGKTTLMRSIANGSVEGFPDASQVRTVFVEADILGELSHLSCIDYVQHDPRLAGIPREEIIAVLAKVGFTDDGKAKPNHPVSSLSGGWRMKLALARAMLQRADILLLDEPTNHLDVLNVKWVINYINSLKNVTAIMVSHDSTFLNACCTNIIHIDRLKLHQYKGNLSHFIETHPDAKAYFTLKESKLSFKFPAPGPIEGIKSRSKALMKMSNCTFTYPGNDKPTLFNITVQVSMASRVGCVGENGAGKSTMIKLLTGEIIPQEGEVWKHPNARVAYVAQHAFHHIEKHLDKTPNEYIRWRYADGTDKESLVKVSMVLTEEEKQLQATVTPIKWKDSEGRIVTGKKRIASMTGNRRQVDKHYEYEVIFDNEARTLEGVYLPIETLTLMGWAKEVKAIDTRIAQTSGQYIRTLSSVNVEQHLADVGLEAEFATHYRMAALSGGQKVKVVLAAALWNQPHILILDEPTNYLDREALGALAGALETFEGGVVIISHNNEFVSQICKEEWVMETGHLTTKGESGWMDRVGDKIDDQQKIDTIVDAFGNVSIIKQKKKMNKKEERAYAKKIKEKLANDIDLDDDEYQFAAANNLFFRA